MNNQRRGRNAITTMFARQQVVDATARIHYYPVAYVPYALFSEQNTFDSRQLSSWGIIATAQGSGILELQGMGWPLLYLTSGEIVMREQQEARTFVRARINRGQTVWAMCYDSGLSDVEVGQRCLLISLKPPKNGGLVNAIGFNLGTAWPSIIPIYPIRAISSRLGMLRAWQSLLSDDIASFRGWAQALHVHAMQVYRKSANDLMMWAHFPPDYECHCLAQRFIASAYHAYTRLMFNDALEALRYPDNPLQNTGVDLDGAFDIITAGGVKMSESQTQSACRLMQGIRRPYQLRALLFGETGSGKTLVSFALSIAAMQAGLNVLYLTPTRVLAQQQMDSFKKIVNGRLDANRVKLWTAQSKDDGSGAGEIYFATHAAFGIPKKFDLAFIDEEQKFSSAQRSQLLSLSNHGRLHLVRMSATPSPLTWELADCGLIEFVHITKQQPQITTRVFALEERMEAYRSAIQQSQGSTMAIICPRIGDRDVVLRKEGDTNAPYGTLAEALSFWRSFGDRARRLCVAFSGAETELEELLRNGGDGSVIIATNLMETGLNLPARVILVEGAEAFSLAQMHQIRGRLSRLGAGETGHFLVICGLPHESPSYKRLSLLMQYDSAIKINEAQIAQWGNAVPSEKTGAFRHRPSMADLVSEDEVAAMTQAMLDLRPLNSQQSLYNLFGVTPAGMLM